MKLSNSYQETRHIITAILILTVIFAFNDNSQKLNPENYATNLIIVLVLVMLSMFAHLFILKLISSRYGITTEFR